MAGSDITWATLVDVVDLGGIEINTGHVVPIPNGPSQIGVVGDWVNWGPLLDTTE